MDKSIVTVDAVGNSDPKRMLVEFLAMLPHSINKVTRKPEVEIHIHHDLLQKEKMACAAALYSVVETNTGLKESIRIFTTLLQIQSIHIETEAIRQLDNEGARGIIEALTPVVQLTREVGGRMDFFRDFAGGEVLAVRMLSDPCDDDSPVEIEMHCPKKGRLNRIFPSFDRTDRKLRDRLNSALGGSFFTSTIRNGYPVLSIAEADTEKLQKNPNVQVAKQILHIYCEGCVAQEKPNKPERERTRFLPRILSK